MRIMSEQRTIELTINMNSIDSIYNDLFKLGVRNGDILLVHTSLSSLGWVCGGAQAVLMALNKL
jgi:aminoglycoside 3-N-acetyltransferase